jgi:two-component system phosphate regulon response regulator PhoB
MPRERILIVEDEEDIRELVRYNLAKEQYQVAVAATAEEARRAVEAAPPELIVLDLMLPDQDGLDFCRRLKAQPATAGIPIVMLTAKGEEADIVAGLEMGADDYVTKPFSPRVLLARIRAVLRRDREPAAGEAPLRVGELTIHLGRHEVLAAGEPAALTATEFRVLLVLARRPGWVFTRGQIAGEIHGDDVVTDRAIDVQIVGLRKKLGAAGRQIETIRGVGYRLRE